MKRMKKYFPNCWLSMSIFKQNVKPKIFLSDTEIMLRLNWISGANVHHWKQDCLITWHRTESCTDTSQRNIYCKCLFQKKKKRTLRTLTTLFPSVFFLPFPDCTQKLCFGNCFSVCSQGKSINLALWVS